jgi:hypothetical protein
LEARRIPAGLFVGSAETVAELHSAIENNKRGSDATPLGSGKLERTRTLLRPPESTSRIASQR